MSNAGPDRERPSTDPLALQDQVCFALVVAARSVVGVYRPVLERLGLTHPQYLVMLVLWEQSPLSVSEIGRLLQLDLPTLSSMLKRLEAVGYLERRRGVPDERTVQISLSDTGRALRDEALGVPKTVMEQLDLDEDEANALRAALTPLVRRSQNAVSRSSGA